jgi:hypothetical protein
MLNEVSVKRRESVLGNGGGKAYKLIVVVSNFLHCPA